MGVVAQRGPDPRPSAPAERLGRHAAPPWPPAGRHASPVAYAAALGFAVAHHIGVALGEEAERHPIPLAPAREHPQRHAPRPVEVGGVPRGDEGSRRLPEPSVSDTSSPQRAVEGELEPPVRLIPDQRQFDVRRLDPAGRNPDRGHAPAPAEVAPQTGARRHPLDRIVAQQPERLAGGMEDPRIRRHGQVPTLSGADVGQGGSDFGDCFGVESDQALLPDVRRQQFAQGQRIPVGGGDRHRFTGVLRVHVTGDAVLLLAP